MVRTKKTARISTGGRGPRHPLAPRDNAYVSEGLGIGGLPDQLWDLLQFLGHVKRPQYHGYRDICHGTTMWRVEVHIYTMAEEPEQRRVSGIFRALVRRTSFVGGIQDAARMAYYQICKQYEDHLKYTNYKHSLKSEAGSTEVEARTSSNGRITTLTSLAMGINMELNRALMELEATQKELMEAQEEVRKLTEANAALAHAPASSESVDGPLHKE